MAAIRAIETHQPASRGYMVLTAFVYLAGLRPSEALALDVEALDLPSTGWGTADISAAVQDHGERWGDADEQIGPTKTAERRTVPLPPVLVEMVLRYLDGRTEGPLVSTRTGNRPTMSNWFRAWNRARSVVGGKWTLYSLRHAYATNLVDTGVTHGETAAILGHTVETLTRYYVGRSDGDRQRAVDLLSSQHDWLSATANDCGGGDGDGEPVD
jgi:integrase